MSGKPSDKGRRPCPRKEDKPAGLEPEVRVWGGTRAPGQRSLPPPARLGVVAMWAAERGGPGCADSLRAALAHGPLRNCQRRGFPRGGHSIQPLHTPRAAAAAPPPPPHKMAAPIEETAAASSAPFCGRREICQHGIPPLRRHPTSESLLEGRNLWGWGGGSTTRKMTTLNTPYSTFLSLSHFLQASVRSGRGPGDGPGDMPRRAGGSVPGCGGGPGGAA